MVHQQECGVFLNLPGLLGASLELWTTIFLIVVKCTFSISWKLVEKVNDDFFYMRREPSGTVKFNREDPLAIKATTIKSGPDILNQLITL